MFEMPILVEDMLDEYIKKAVSTAKNINSLIFGEAEQAPSASKKEEKTEKPEEEEEETAGIGGLFGGGGEDEDEDEDEDSPNIGGLF
jgi:ribosomal protein L12E/L44/L45/RPP1/RPP2